MMNQLNSLSLNIDNINMQINNNIKIKDSKRVNFKDSLIQKFKTLLDNAETEKQNSLTSIKCLDQIQNNKDLKSYAEKAYKYYYFCVIYDLIKNIK